MAKTEEKKKADTIKEYRCKILKIAKKEETNFQNFTPIDQN